MTVILIVTGVIPAIALITAIAVLRAGIGREDADHSIRGLPSTRSSAVTRRMTGLYVRMPQPKHPEDQDTPGWDNNSPWYTGQDGAE